MPESMSSQQEQPSTPLEPYNLYETDPVLRRAVEREGAGASDADLAELLNWILTTMSSEQLGEDFNYYTASEVKLARAILLPDVAKTRADLVASMKPTH